MKKTKKVLAVLTAAVMCLSFTACGTKTTTNTASKTAANPLDKTNKAFDMGGRTITQSFNWDAHPNSSDPAPDPATATETDIMVYKNMQRVMAKYDIKFMHVNTPWGDLQPKFQSSVLAGQPYVDLVDLPSNAALSAVVNGQVLPVSDYTTATSDVNSNKKFLEPGFIINGKAYALNNVNIPIGGQYLGYNKDMLTKYGLEDPATLLKDGKWTWDAYEKLAIACTKDTNGDGKMDTYGVCGVPLLTTQGFIGANDGYLVDPNTQKDGLSDPKTMEAIGFVGKLYNTDKVWYMPTKNYGDWDKENNAFKEGKAAMFYLETWMLPANTSSDALKFDFGIVPFPAGPSTTTGSHYLQGINGNTFIGKGTKDPDKVYTVYEEMSAWYGDDNTKMQDGTMNWLNSLFVSPDDVTRQIDISKVNAKPDIYSAIDGYPINDVIQKIFDKKETVAQAVAEDQQIADQSIKDSFTPSDKGAGKIKATSSVAAK